jgi:alkylhydroperoxidase/carboxymuconolactone decarboxylase family protein YurZ
MAITGDLERAREAWERAEAQQVFWQEHRAEFLERFPDQFVAASPEGDVIAADPDLQRLTQLLVARGIEPTSTWIQFIATDPQRYLL